VPRNSVFLLVFTYLFKLIMCVYTQPMSCANPKGICSQIYGFVIPLELWSTKAG